MIRIEIRQYFYLRIWLTNVHIEWHKSQRYIYLFSFLKKDVMGCYFHEFGENHSTSLSWIAEFYIRKLCLNWLDKSIETHKLCSSDGKEERKDIVLTFGIITELGNL